MLRKKAPRSFSWDQTFGLDENFVICTSFSMRPVLPAFEALLSLAALQCAAAYMPAMPATSTPTRSLRLLEPFAAPDTAPALDNTWILETHIAKPSLRMRCLAESAGTSFLVLGFSLISRLGLSLAASSIGIGLVIATAVGALAEVSGAHFNPAITLSLAAAGDLRLADASAYVFSQCAGAFFAAGLASLLAGGVSVPAAPATFGNEVALTAALVFGCLGIGDWASRGLVTAKESPALVGSWICALSMGFTQRLGAGLNPAISFGVRAAAAAAGAPGGRLLLAGASSFMLAPLLGGLGGAGLLAAWLGHGTGCFTTVAKLPSKLYSRDLDNGLDRRRVRQSSRPVDAPPASSAWRGVVVPTRRPGVAASAASAAEREAALSSVQRLAGGDTRWVNLAMDP